MLELIQNIEFEPFLISFKLAGITTLILFVLCLPLAWYLSQTKSKLKPIFESFTAMPLVVPPTVLGFYLLVGLSHNSVIGQFFHEYFGITLVFNFNGLVIASCFYSLPFMVQPLQSVLESLNKNMLEASYISGKGKFETLLRVALPNIKPSLLTAFIITFAHTVGEFGVVLMIGGSIPGETRVASIAIYEFVEVLDYKNAHFYSLIMVIMSFLTLLAVYIFNGKQKRDRLI